MARFRRSGSRGRFRSNRPARGVDWGGAGSTFSIGPGGQAAVWVLPPSEVRTFYTDPTFMKAKVAITHLTSTIAPAAPAFSGLWFGLIRFGGDADSLTPVPPNVNMPNPFDDPEADWLYHYAGIIPPGVAAGSLSAPLAAESLIWTRAMRRLGNSEGILAVFFSAGVTQTVAWDVRYLLKE